MKLYLGNDSDVEIDVEEDDEIILAPTKAATSSITYNVARNRYIAFCWSGLVCKNMYLPISCFKSTAEAYKAAKYYIVGINANTVNTLLKCKVKDLSVEILNNFRYIQPTLEYRTQDVPLDPYLVGVWLGDGSTASGDITNVDYAVIDYCQKYAKKNGMNFVPRKEDGITYFFQSNTSRGNVFRQTLNKMGVLGKKHIPNVYCENALEIRLSVLAGLLDTDGSLLGNYYEITQKKVDLANDIVRLAQSCGFFVRTVDKWGYATNTEAKTRRLYKRIYIYLNRNSPIIPVFIDRKKFDPENVQFEHGTVIRLEPTSKNYRNEWTDEMKSKFVETRDKYKKSNGTFQWKKIVDNEELYKHMSPEALRAYNRCV